MSTANNAISNAIPNRMTTDTSNIITVNICIADIEDEIDGYIEKINADIGFYWWKRYIYSAFWSNISTPINLSIIILTALTTGQNATQNLISPETSTILGATVLFVSIFNTFFKPHEQLVKNQSIMEDWVAVGIKFDEIYYNRVYTVEEKTARLNSLEDLFKSLSVLKRSSDNNYLIDLLYCCVRFTCIRNNLPWIKINKANTILNKSRRLTHINTAPLRIVGSDNTLRSVPPECSRVVQHAVQHNSIGETIV
jgi:hypothetical protein